MYKYLLQLYVKSQRHTLTIYESYYSLIILSVINTPLTQPKTFTAPHMMRGVLHSPLSNSIKEAVQSFYKVLYKETEE